MSTIIANWVYGTEGPDRITGFKGCDVFKSDLFFISKGKDKITHFDTECDSIIFEDGVKYRTNVRNNKVILRGKGFKTVIKGVSDIDSIKILYESNLYNDTPSDICSIEINKDLCKASDQDPSLDENGIVLRPECFC